jgi:hypothetical protein
MPAAAKAQRDPTAIDDVVTAAPSMPVLAQRAAIENVIARRP